MSSRVRNNRLRNRLFRKGQTGQSLILLAIGFIALLAFVGIVTDISLLFVRYSTLRRAVDAAAVAAAGQMRRVPNADGSSIGNPEPGLNNDTGQAVSVANLNLAARQFIEVYGLNPEQVIAETCYAQAVPRDGAGRPLDRNGVLLYNYSGTTKTGPNGGSNGEDRARYEELCKDNELKLVRVTAQIDSPTVFLRLLGVPSITLTESSISQTAVLDVVLILDVSESMSYETTYADWETQGYYTRYVPPKVGQYEWERWPELLSNSMSTIMMLPNDWDGSARYGVDSVAPFLAATTDPETGEWVTGPTIAYTPPLPSGVTNKPTRDACQVRVAPTTVFGWADDIPPWLRQEYVEQFGASWVAQRFDSGSTAIGNFRGFVPMYRSYACCNDPNGDFDFGDLVCRPFQQVRSATASFLNNLDFVRGDRVAFVTFENSAYIVDPDGAGPQSPMIEVEHNLDINGDGTINTALNERHGAQEVLSRVVGVRAEPTYYGDANDDGRWDGLMEYDPSAPGCSAGTPANCWQGKDWAYFQNTPIGDIFVQPNINSCYLDRAMLVPPQVPDYYMGRQYGSGETVWPLLTDAISPSWFWDSNAAIPGDATSESLYWSRRPEHQSAEYRGGCGSGNIGSGLANAQQALIDGGRTEGAVWLMVLLSDGASGVTDPIQRNSGTELNYPNVYNQVTADAWDPIPGDYGVFGACPYGTQGSPAELPLDGDFPFCSDKEPRTRYFCSDEPMVPTLFELDSPDCNEDYYDADDYAHDWADWIALAGLVADERQSDEQLPTLFTIGIGLDFSPINPETGTVVCSDTDWNCRRNQPWTWEDYLGEQLLRYIADVGDNNQLDDDYWQCVMQERIPNSVYRLDPNTLVRNCEDKTLPEWGPRGPCERQSIDPAAKGVWAPLDPQVSCGNYFAAATPSDLERVFSIIASRMFTRLSQ